MILFTVLFILKRFYMEKFIKIDVGHQDYAIPIEDFPNFQQFTPDNLTSISDGKVELYTSMKNGKDAQENNELSPFYRLRSVLGKETKEAEILNMVQDKIQAHVDWINSLEESIETGKAFTKARDHTQCALGKWRIQYSKDNRDIGVNKVLTELDGPHQRIHSLADKLLKIAETDKEKALEVLVHEKNTTLKEVLEKLGTLSENLIAIERELVMTVDSVQDGTTKKVSFLIDNVMGTLEVGKNGTKKATNNEDILIDEEKPVFILDLLKIIEQKDYLKHPKNSSTPK